MSWFAMNSDIFQFYVHNLNFIFIFGVSHLLTDIFFLFLFKTNEFENYFTNKFTKKYIKKPHCSSCNGGK